MDVLLAGATGLVGSAVLRQLEACADVGIVFVLTRRPVEDSSTKVRQLITDFADDYQSRLPDSIDAVLCCLGTTIRKAGSQRAFRTVDFDYVVNLAEVCEAKGIPHFGVVSSLGASARSKVFYSRVKGEMERTIREKDIRSIRIYQPSLIQGSRSDFRPLERVSELALTAFEFMLVGGLKQYRPNSAEVIAAAMISAALEQRPGVEVVARIKCGGSDLHPINGYAPVELI